MPKEAKKTRKISELVLARLKKLDGKGRGHLIELGRIEATIHSLNAKKAEVLEKHSSINVQYNEVVDEVREEYGDNIQFNIDTGEIIEPGAEAQDGEDK